MGIISGNIHTEKIKQHSSLTHIFGRTAGCHHECLLVPLSWLVEYVEVIQAASGVWLQRAASKMLTNCLSGEHGEQQGVLINNAELSAYRTPGLALSNICYTMIDRVWNVHTIRPCHANSEYIFKSDIAYTTHFHCKHIHLYIHLCIRLHSNSRWNGPVFFFSLYLWEMF